MTAGISQDTMLRINSRYYKSTNDGKVREWPQTQQQQTQQSASNPVPVVQQNPPAGRDTIPVGRTASSNGLSQREINRIKKEDKDKPLDEKSIYSIEEELKDILTKTEVNNKTVYKAATKFTEQGILEEQYFIYNGKTKKFVRVDSTGKNISTPVSYTPSELREAVNKAKSDQAEDAKNEEEKTMMKEYGYISAAEVYHCLKKCNTRDKEFNQINRTLGNINKDNVVEFLSEYYKESEFTGDLSERGLIDRLDIARDHGRVTMANQKNLIQSLLQAADKYGLQNDSNYKEIAEILSKYTDGEFKDNKTFTGDFWHWHDNTLNEVGKSILHVGTLTGLGALTAGKLTGNGWVVLGAAGVMSTIATVSDIYQHVTRTGLYEYTDGEKLDVAMYELHKKILQKQRQQTYSIPSYIPGGRMSHMDLKA